MKNYSYTMGFVNTSTGGCTTVAAYYNGSTWTVVENQTNTILDNAPGSYPAGNYVVSGQAVIAVTAGTAVTLAAYVDFLGTGGNMDIASINLVATVLKK